MTLSNPRAARARLSSLALLAFAFFHLAAAAGPVPGEFSLPPSLSTSARVPCIPSFYCPGNQTAMWCPQNHYCPTPAVAILCPEGYFCPPASTEPRACSVFASCPAGSSRFLFWGGIVVMILILPIMFGIRNAIRRQSRKQPDKASTPSSTKGSLGTVPIEIAFTDVHASVTVNNVPKVVTRGLTGKFLPGRLTAVMGPSGAGKTSLFRVLTGLLPLSQGTLTINGKSDRLSNFRRLVGQVPQDDIMIRTLTVRDLLVHSALSRLPTSISWSDKMKRVDEVISLLGLENVQHSIVGDSLKRGISGGECKRTSIGMELVSNPSLLLLDEPTTGLDSAIAEDVCSLLKQIAALRVNVVAILHQPSFQVFDMMDDLLLLAAGGRQAYFGPAANTLGYFASIGYPCPARINPADWFLDVVSGKVGLPTDPEQHSAEAVAEYLVKCFEAEKADRMFTGPPQWPLPSAAATASTSQSNGSAPTTADAKVSESNGSSNGSSAATTAVASPPLIASHTRQPSLDNFREENYPGRRLQTLLSFRRGLLQNVRNLDAVIVELFLHMLTGLVIGLAFVKEFWFIPPLPPQYAEWCPGPISGACVTQATKDQIGLVCTYTVMALGLTASLIGNRTFGQEMQSFMRDSTTGLNIISYMVGKFFCDLPIIALYSFIYCIAFFTMVSPISTFNDFYTLIFIYELIMFAVGYVSSVALRDQQAFLLSCIASLLPGLASDMRSSSNQVSWSSWFSEALWIAMARASTAPPQLNTVLRAYAKGRNNFNLDNYAFDIGIMFAFVFALRVLAVLILRTKRNRALMMDSPWTQLYKWVRAQYQAISEAMH